VIRVVQISDSHHSAADSHGPEQWQRVIRLIAALEPDLVIDTGDMARDDPTEAADRRLAAASHRELGVPVLSLPGNHDIGDGPPSGIAPDAALLAAFETEHGAAHWVHDTESWRLVGVNALLFGTSHLRETAEWSWLDLALRSAGGRPTALFVHKPPFLVASDETTATSATMPASIRRRFWDLVTAHDVRLVACGHRHEYRVHLVDGIQIVWAPTTSRLLDERSAPLEPVVWPGIVEYAFIGRTVLHRPHRLVP
jgi:3',5'-cyclic AMP phosphodiesterase CpdA